MLQIDHIYEFLHNSVFKDFELHAFDKGVPTESSYIIFNKTVSPRKILFYDQEPILDKLSEPYLDYFNIPYTDIAKIENSTLSYITISSRVTSSMIISLGIPNLLKSLLY